MATSKRTLYQPTKLDRLVALGETGTAYDPDTQDQAVVIAGFIVSYHRTPVEAEIALSRAMERRAKTLRNLADQAAVQTESDAAWQAMGQAAEESMGRNAA